MRSSIISRPVIALTLVALVTLWAASLFIRTASSAQGSPTYTAEWNAQTGQFPEQVCPSWELNDTAAPENPVFSAGKLRISTTPNSERMEYGQFEPDIVFPAVTTIEARLRFVSGSSSSANRTAANILFTTAPNVGNGLYIGQDEIFLLAAGDVRGATARVDTNGAFHTYQINIDSSGAITVLYDGVPTLTGSTWSSAPHHGSVRRVIWGDITTLASGTSDWEFVRHNAAECKPCVAAPSGMVSWWPADGNALDIQDGNPGTLQNGATFAPGRVGQAFSFDGVNDFVSFGTSVGNFGTADFTIDFWIKTTATRFEGIIGKRPVCNNASMWDFRINQGRLVIELTQDSFGNNRNVVYSVSQLNDGISHHVALVRTGTTVTLYVDGTPEYHPNSRLERPLPNSITNISNSAALIAGKSACSGLGDDFHFTGQLDELEIFNRALAPSEIQAIYNAGGSGKCRTCSSPPTGMAAWWPLDGNANDIQGSHHGTPQNGATFAPGMVEQAVSLDGVDDYVEVPDSPSLTPSSITLDAWVKPNSLSGERVIVSKYHSGNPSQGVSWLLRTIPGTGRLLFLVYQDALGNIRRFIETNSSVLTTGVWQHVTATFDVATQAMKIYVNGVEVPSTLFSGSATITSIYDSNTPVRIGVLNAAGSFVNFWSGLIDEVEIFNRALSAAEIQAIVKADSAGKCKNVTPDAVNDTATTNEDTAITIAVLANDADPNGDSLTVTGVTQGSNGSVVNNGDGTVTYTPNANFNGADSFTYTISDGRGGTDTATVNVTVTAINDPPDAVNDAATTNEDTPVNITVLANDTDAEGDTRTVSGVTQPANGTATVNPDGTVTYAPNANFNGTDSFGYVISDGNGGSDSATGTVTVTPINDAPVAANDAYSVNEDTTLTVAAPGVLGNDSDVDGDTLTAVLVSNITNGTLSLNANGSFTYTPNANFNGGDSFTYQAKDASNAARGIATVIITVNTVNDPPVANSQSVATDEDTAQAITLTATDADSDTLTYSIVTLPAHGTLSGTAPNLTYTPAPNYNGPDSFTFKANDGTVDSNTAMVSITVNAVNDPPLANNQSVTTSEDTGKAITLTATDVDGDALTYAIVTPPTHGTLSGTAPNLTYTPALNYTGPDSFTFKANDGTVNSNTATISISVVAVNDPPTANAGGPYSVAEGGSVVVTASGSDPESDSLTYAWDLDNDGTFEAPGQSVSFSAAGLDGPSSRTVKVRVTDSGDLSTTSTATVTVVNVAPTASFANTSGAINEGGAATLVFSNKSDPSVADTQAGFRYSYDCNNDGSFEISDTTAASYSCVYPDNGAFTAKGRIKDKDGALTDYTVTVTVTNVAPTVGAITAPVDPIPVNTAVNASASFTDPGTRDTHTAVWNWGDGGTSAGVVTETNGSGSVSGSHTYTVAGVYTVTLTVTDDDGGAGRSMFEYIVVYDPGAGFVTGGGWINSPTGAYVPNPSLTGKANFGFVSKYKPGANVPTGNTEFQFKAAGLNFHSTSYEWLVVAGKKAQYKGLGTVNGSGSYRFMLTAIDGDQPGGGGQDKFRIRIWSDGGGLLYDNQLNAPDSDDPTTVLGGGSIVIHK